ncbi:MAG: glycosyltransferase 87 family protein [Candidatus Latescibacterota bacterium]|jgi:hypothetical protein
MSHLQRPALWIGAGLALHLLFLSALFGDWLRPLFNDASHTRRGFDFGVFYLAGQALAQGRDIYAVEGAFGYRYLPVFAQIFGRLYALLAPLPAYLLHLFFSELFLLANLWLTKRLFTEPLQRSRALFMWMAFSPLFLEFYIGQVSFWAASLFYWLIVALGSKQPRVHAALWAAAILVKPNMLILLPALVRLRHFRAVSLALTGTALVTIPYFLIYPAALFTFTGVNLQVGHFKGALTHAGNLGLWGTLVSLGAKLSAVPLAELSSLSDLPLWAALPAYIIPVITVIATLYITFTSRSADPVLHLSLWMTTYFLVYKDIWEHHYVFLLPVFVTLYARSHSAQLLWIYAALAIPTPFVFFDTQAGIYGPIDPEREWSLLTTLTYRSAKLAPTLVFWLWIVARHKKAINNPK